jgi:hypothetical protein
MRSLHRTRVLACRCLLIALSSLTSIFSVRAAGADDAQDTPEIDAIWHVQSLPFLFRGRHVLYNCTFFQKKLHSILVAVGADPSLIIQTSCTPNAITDRITVRIALATPVEATADNIAAATSFDSKRELLARLQKTPLPTPSAIEKFRARMRSVTLEDSGELQLEPSDCELLIALTDQVFPKLNVEVEKNLLFCTEAVARTPQLKVRALFHVDDEIDTSRGK